MKRVSFVIALLIVAGLAGYGSSLKAEGKVFSQEQMKKTEAVVPLQGLDPVVLVQDKEVMGKAEFSVTRGQFKYWFANAENRARFEKDPARYEIQMEGHCPVVPDATGNPDLYMVYKGRIYIFATDGCVEEFKAGPENFVKP